MNVRGLRRRLLFFSGARRVLVGTNDRGVEHEAFEIRVLPSLEEPFPNATLGPSVESLEYRVPFPETFRQIPPRRARLGDPQELANLAAFLASPRAAYITGQSIAVDGGAIRSH